MTMKDKSPYSKLWDKYCLEEPHMIDFGKVYKMLANNDLVHKNLSVMEFGFGSGYFLEYLLNCYLNVSGCEVSDIAIAKAKSMKPYPPNIIKCKNGGIPLADNSFDLIFCIKSLSAVQQNVLESVSKELYRVLKQNGYLLIVDFFCTEHDQIDTINFCGQEIQVVKPKWIDVPLFHFSIENLERILGARKVSTEYIQLQSYNGNAYPGIMVLLQKSNLLPCNHATI